jgi:2-oxoglutarate dehydrogenase E2 component (dihydrolipoamide succinyltransferase)
MPIDIIMPQLGESVVEGTITKWLVKPGDAVRRDQAVVEVATDKADSEVPSPAAGRVSKILAQEGTTVKIGAVLCVLETGAPAEPAKEESKTAASETVNELRNAYVASIPIEHLHSSLPDAQTFAPRGEQKVHPRASVTGEETTVTWRPPVRDALKAPARAEFPDAFASPAVRRLALEHGVDLKAIQGTGEHGRVTRDDVLRRVGLDVEAIRAPGPMVPDPAPLPMSAPLPRKIPAETKPVQVASSSADLSQLASMIQQGGGFVAPVPGVGYRAYKVAPYVPKEGDQVIPFTRRRRLTADHMVYSKLVAPHVVTVAEIDLFETMRLREKYKDAYKKEGISLTVLAFVCSAVARALRENPGINARVLDDSYVLLRDIHLGVAVDAPDGLVVPNIKHADELSLRGIARGIGQVATKAREGKLSADDFAGTSFCVSNPGLKGNLFGGAIISQPASGILRTGEIKKRVVVVEQDGCDTMAIHPVMYAALSYDHRIIDGVLANSFLWRVAEILAKGDFSL